MRRGESGCRWAGRRGGNRRKREGGVGWSKNARGEGAGTAGWKNREHATPPFLKGCRARVPDPLLIRFSDEFVRSKSGGCQNLFISEDRRLSTKLHELARRRKCNHRGTETQRRELATDGARMHTDGEKTRGPAAV